MAGMIEDVCLWQKREVDVSMGRRETRIGDGREDRIETRQSRETRRDIATAVIMKAKYVMGTWKDTREVFGSKR